MNKNEILSRAQKEPDEMEYEILSKALGISTIIIPLLCLLFMIGRIINNKYIVSDLIVLVLSQVLIQQVYQFIKIKKIKNLIFIILLSVMIIIFLVLFFNEVSLWKSH